jgi:hypothetical protein
MLTHAGEQASSSLEQERARLSQEHSRLERMQRSLETERQLVKEMLASELKRARQAEQDGATLRVRADEAAELGFLAYAAADWRAARLWCAIALSGSAAQSARAQQLKTLLQ